MAIYTGDEVAWKADTAAADPKRGLPPRIFVDIPGAGIREEILHRPVAVRNGLLRQVRAGRFSRDVVRVVIDLERESTYRVFTLENPFRIVIDIDGEGEIPVPRAEADPPQPASPPAPSPDAGTAASTRASRAPAAPPAAEAGAGRAASGSAAPSPRRHRVRVVIDPGHGGKGNAETGLATAESASGGRESLHLASAPSR